MPRLNSCYVVMFQGSKVELHLLIVTDDMLLAEAIAWRHLHRINENCSLVIAHTHKEQEGYTNFIDYKLSDDGKVIHRTLWDQSAIHIPRPEMDSKYRPVITS